MKEYGMERHNFNLHSYRPGLLGPYPHQLSFLEVRELSSSTVCYENNFSTYSVRDEKEIDCTMQQARRRS